MGYDTGCLLFSGLLSLSRVHVDDVLRFDLWCIDPPPPRSGETVA